MASKLKGSYAPKQIEIDPDAPVPIKLIDVSAIATSRLTASCGSATSTGRGRSRLLPRSRHSMRSVHQDRSDASPKALDFGQSNPRFPAA